MEKNYYKSHCDVNKLEIIFGTKQIKQKVVIALIPF